MIDKKSLCVKTGPGPQGGPLQGVNGSAATHPSPPHNGMSGDIRALGWWGPDEKSLAPFQWMKPPTYTAMDVLNATKQASADMLV
jgi:hypothetical protein